MGNKIKLQHYVPRFYLDNFAIKDKGHFLYCLNKSTSRSFIVNSKNIASETYFYDTPQDVKQQTEKALSHFEASFEDVIKKLIVCQDISALEAKERLYLAYFVATQEVRTREHRAVLEDMHKQTIDALSKRGVPSVSIKKLELTEEEIKLWHISSFEDVPDYAEIISNMKWILFLNRTSMPFWCSDHPVNRFNYIAQKPYGNLGLLCKGIEVHCPLSPIISIVMCDLNTYHLLPGKSDLHDIRNIEFLNWLQVYYSTRYIFANNSDFSLAKKIIDNDPSLGKIDRKRLLVD